MTMRALIRGSTKRGEQTKVRCGRNAGCPCSRSRGTLIVTCQGCAGGQDLGDIDCLKGVLRALASEPSATHEIVLSSHWEVRYDQGCTTALNRLAEAVRFLKGVNFEPRFEECPDCPSNPLLVASRAAAALPQACPELREDHPPLTSPRGRACEQCVRSTEGNLLHARTLLASAYGAVNRLAYRVVSDGAR